MVLLFQVWGRHLNEIVANQSTPISLVKFEIFNDLTGLLSGVNTNDRQMLECLNFPVGKELIFASS